MNNPLQKTRGNLERLSSLANRLFGEWESPLSEYSLDFKPSLDLSEDEEEYYVEAELPGLNKEDIDVTVSENTLTIRGEKKEEEEVDERDYHRIERNYGSFQRQVTLPYMDEEAPVEAESSKGILKVRIPKAEKAKTRKIDVKVNK